MHIDLDNEKKEMIESIINRKITVADRVDGLENLPENIAREAKMITVANGGNPIMAIQYLIFITGASLRDLKGYADDNFWGLDRLDD